MQWTGFKTTAEQILELFDGLQQSGLDNFQYLLTGYLPNAATVSAVGEIAKRLKRKDPEITWRKSHCSADKFWIPSWAMMACYMSKKMSSRCTNRSSLMPTS